MPTLYVTEYAELAKQPVGHQGQAVMEPPLAEQTVSFSTSTQSSAFNAKTRWVRIHTDAICSILFGTDPTATTSKQRLTAGQTQYHGVPVGASYKVATVTNT